MCFAVAQAAAVVAKAHHRMAQALYYMCSFSLGNFTYLYRCRTVDQYCCGHTCCYKDKSDEDPNLFESWYFWSLILVVVLVFGCIVVSFVLSSLKQRHDIESWTMMAGTAFNHLATTVIGKNGIIQPRLHYQPPAAKKDNQGVGAAADNNVTRGRRGTETELDEDAAERLRTLQRIGDWGRRRNSDSAAELNRQQPRRTISTVTTQDFELREMGDNLPGSVVTEDPLMLSVTSTVSLSSSSTSSSEEDRMRRRRRMDRRLQRRSRKKKKNPIPEDDDEGGGADDSNGKSRPGSSSLMRQLSFEFLPEHSIVEISIDELKNEMAKTTSPEANGTKAKTAKKGLGSKAPKRWVDAQLRPLRPAYKSSWSGSAAELRMAASTQVFFPPGFINS